MDGTDEQLDQDIHVLLGVLKALSCRPVGARTGPVDSSAAPIVNLMSSYADPASLSSRGPAH
jgi:hypothetical protein